MWSCKTTQSPQWCAKLVKPPPETGHEAQITTAPPTPPPPTAAVPSCGDPDNTAVEQPAQAWPFPHTSKRRRSPTNLFALHPRLLVLRPRVGSRSHPRD